MKGRVFKLLPDDYKYYWPIVRYGLQQAVPPTAGDGLDALRKILIKLMAGRAQGWVYEEDRQIKATSVTYIERDQMTGERFLVFYSLYAYTVLPLETWRQLLKTLLKFAQANKCARIIAYIQDDSVVEMAKVIGFKKTGTTASLEVSYGW